MGFTGRRILLGKVFPFINSHLSLYILKNDFLCIYLLPSITFIFLYVMIDIRNHHACHRVYDWPDEDVEDLSRLRVSFFFFTTHFKIA